MIATPYLHTVEPIQFNEVLADAVVLSWNDVIPDSKSGLIHIEYQSGSPGSVEFVKVWASAIRGDWSLICGYWMNSGMTNKSGLRFGIGQKAAELGRSLESIMQHQKAFLSGAALGSEAHDPGAPADGCGQSGRKHEE